MSNREIDLNALLFNSANPSGIEQIVADDIVTADGESDSRSGLDGAVLAAA